MITSIANNAAAPRQVACHTSDHDEIPVDLDVLRLSKTFIGMCDELGLEEHGEFPGIFPVPTISTFIFERVIWWCKKRKGVPEPVVEKDPLSQECKWLILTFSERRFFALPMPELLELVMAAKYLDIPLLVHYACQAVAARIKGKSPPEICKVLQQDCDLEEARIKEIRADNPWLSSVSSGARIENAIFIPNEVLLIIFEKLPREDLERLQLVSAQFDGVIVNSSELSEQQGPLRIVDEVEFGAYPYIHMSRGMSVWERGPVTYANHEDLAKRLKFSVVQKLRVADGGMYDADIQEISAVLRVKSVWKNATVHVFVNHFPSQAVFEFFFTELLLCKEIILRHAFFWSWLHLPAIAACRKLDLSELNYDDDEIEPDDEIESDDEIEPDDVVEWLEREAPPEDEDSEPRTLALNGSMHRGIDGLLPALKTAFSASSSRKPYVVRFPFPGIQMDEVLVNENTHEKLTIRIGESNWVTVKRG